MVVTDWQARHGLTGADYQHAFDELVGRGYRLVKVTGCAQGGTARYAGIWQRRGGSPWQARHGISEADYQSTVTTLGGANYRVTHVSAFRLGNSTCFNAIWEQDPGFPMLARHRLNSSEYQALFDSLSRRGWRLRCVSGYEEGGEAKYACVWDEYAGPAWQARHGLDAQAYQQTFDTLARDGFRLIQVCGYTVRGRQLFAAVWEQSPGHDWKARHGVADTAYQAEFDAAVQHGLRLVDVSAYENGSGLAYTSIWEDGLPDQPSGDAVKGVVVPFMQKWAVPGLTCSVARNGSLIATRTFGYANPITREIVTAATRFRVASVSKPITSAAICRLIEQGQLALGDRVFGSGARLGTTFGTTPYGMYVTSITIQHLLQHTSGGWQNDNMDPMFQQPALSANDLISWTLDNRPLANPPGTSYAYSNFGYCVLARVIEAVTGQSYEDYVRASVLAPCGVTDMRVGGDTGLDRQWPEATYWARDLNNAYAMRVRRMDGHGGWLATPTDLLKFGLRVDGFAIPSDILQAATITTMTTGSAVNANYACGWGVNGTGTRQHDGLLPGTLAILLRNGAQHEWAAACNLGIVGSPVLSEFLTTISQVDALV
jgi:CubicO group peptidase (beta-lactamase class C family)